MLNSYKTFNCRNFLLKYKFTYFKTQTQLPLQYINMYFTVQVETTKKGKKPQNKAPWRTEVGLYRRNRALQTDGTTMVSARAPNHSILCNKEKEPKIS